jgi:D-xylose transport system substrate-binding protein
MDQAITALGKNNIGGVVAANDALAGAVIASLKNAGIDPHTIPITGLDADLDGLKNILAGEQAMTVYQPIGTEESVNAQIAVALGRGKPVPQQFVNGPGPVPTYLYKTVIVTAQNMKDTVMKEAGYVDPSQLCSGQTKPDCAKYGIQ